MANCHPAVNFFYFAAVLLCTMFFRHPVLVAISLLGALCYALRLGGRPGRTCAWMLPLLLLTAVLNPLFSHAGATILIYLPGGNPLTLESILFGIGAAAMLGATLLWFGSCTTVLTTDQFVYLFGRVAPAGSLLLSMALRLVPRFRTQLHSISLAQQGLGRRPTGLIGRARQGVKTCSILITWALENGIETADSMKSRGYGLPGRTAFSRYRFTRRDGAVLLFCALCVCYLLIGAARGSLTWHYYPLCGGAAGSPYRISLELSYLALCGLPTVLDWKEARLWHN